MTLFSPGDETFSLLLSRGRNHLASELGSEGGGDRAGGGEHIAGQDATLLARKT